MEVTNIYLARHGQTEYNRRNQLQGRGIDASLNDTGRRQARAIAEHLKGVSLDRIFCSSLKRSRETAKLVAQMHDLELESYSDLDEMNFGELEGRPIAEIEKELEELQRKWKSGETGYALQGGESPSAVLERAASRIELLMAEHKNSNLLFVLHGRLIRILVAHWLEYGLSEMHRVPHTNGALYHIRWNGELFEPIYLNQTEHLVNGTAE